MILSEKLKASIALLPDSPGVYQMKDKDGNIIYIGKAKNLKKRVSQYFLRPQVGKVAAMVSHVDDFSFIMVKTDKEAFILEMNLIQVNHPRYNIMLMDDSHYPYIALKRDDASLSLVRNAKDKRYFYFGPFPNAYAAKKTLSLLNSIYPTRKCAKLGKKACLYFSLNQCLAPCVNKISEETYKSLYEEIKDFMGGNTSKVIASLKEKMDEASSSYNFEQAAEIKRTMDSINQTVSKQVVENITEKINKDVLGFAEREGYRSLSILTYKHGLLLGEKDYIFPAFMELEEQISELLGIYYQNNELPDQIVSNIPKVKETLSSLFDTIEIVSPKEGKSLKQVEMAALNAKKALDAHFMSARLEDDKEEMLEELGRKLNIKTPYRIELFDNSHLQGSLAVSALVVFVNGMPNKKMYRKYHLSESVSGDDYHSMVEVTYRRYKRLKDENASYPDLILTDGGLSQVHATKEGLRKADVDIPVYGLYKNDKHQTEGIIDQEGNIYQIDNKSPLFFLLMRMQDEVHRFAISFHKKERSKKMLKSVFDDIKGLGEKRKETLRKHYPSMEDFKKASYEELSQLFPKDVVDSLMELKERTKE